MPHHSRLPSSPLLAAAVSALLTFGAGCRPNTAVATFDAGAAPDAGPTPDAGGPDSGTTDAGPPERDAGDTHDAGEPEDAGPPFDAGTPDSGVTPDAGEPEDAGTPDSGIAVVDAGAHDAGPIVDAGTADAGPTVDAGAPTYGDYCQTCGGQGDCGDGGFCLQSQNGMLVCGSPCDIEDPSTCPSTASCIQINNGSGVFEGYNCFPNSQVCPAANEPDAGSTLYCQPCTTSGQCGSGLCLTEQNGDFCGTPCTATSQCPSGAYCAMLGNTSEMNCAPDNQICPVGVDAGPADAGIDAGPEADAGMPDAGLGGESDGGLVTIPLTGCPSTGYSAPVTMGGSQHFSLVVDTGSSTLAVAASDCDDCTGISPLYTPGPTATSLNVESMSTYGDGSSITSYLYSDIVAVGAEMPTVTLDFAAIHDQQNHFFPTVDCEGNTSLDTSQGILGMGPADLEAGGTQGYFQQLIQTGAVPDMFAVQLCATGGNMWFGGYDAAFVSGAPQFTPMAMSNYYAVALSLVSFDGTALSYSTSEGGPALIDTGTTLFILPSDGFSELANAVAANAAVMNAFNGITSGFFSTNSCMQPSGNQTTADLDATLPTLSLEFPSASSGSFTVQFPATSSYFTPIVQSGTTFYCSGIAPPPSGTPATTILGASILTSNVMVFDPSHMQVGFAPEVGCQ